MTNKQLLKKISEVSGDIQYLNFKVIKDNNYYNLYCDVYRINKGYYSILVEYDYIDEEKINRRMINIKEYIKDYYRVV